MMQSQGGRSLSLALARLRFVVHGCCWVAALALVAQSVIWLMAMFTEVRFEYLSAGSGGSSPMVVQTPGENTPRTTTVEKGEVIAGNAKLNPNLVFSRYDRLMARIVELASGFGIFATIMLLPAVMLGVQLSAGKTVSGAEKTVSAFCWSIVVCALVLPLGDLFHLPWDGGALRDYESMTSIVDARGVQELPASVQGTLGETPTMVELYANHLALPVACIFGLLLVGFRFSSGVEAAIVHLDEMRLDPELERETANIRPSSLHGGRSGAALRNVMTDGGAPAPERDTEHAGSARTVSPGTRPSRLI